MSNPCIALAFGERLHAERLAAGLTQQRLAELAEMDPAEISRYEKGARSPRLDTVVRLASALGVRPGRLVDPPEVAEISAEIADIIALLRDRSDAQVRLVREAIALLPTPRLEP